MSFKSFLVLIIFLGLFWSFLIEPNLITIKKLTLKSEDIKGLRIVFVSDFHLNKMSELRLKRIVDKINKQNPDIVFSGGDYSIGHNPKISMNMQTVAKNLSKIQAKYGFYTVFGNHDYNKHSNYVKDSFKKYNINILENSNYHILHNNKSLFVAGISDMQTTYYSLDKALVGTKPPIILISHSPDITPSARGKVNLILSGHTHGGQVRVPLYGGIIVPSKYGKRYESGFVENLVYINRGLGTSILPIRFNCPPEITVIDYI